MLIDNDLLESDIMIFATGRKGDSYSMMPSMHFEYCTALQPPMYSEPAISG